jgi:VWFA-related protein
MATDKGRQPVATGVHCLAAIEADGEPTSDVLTEFALPSRADVWSLMRNSPEAKWPFSRVGASYNSLLGGSFLSCLILCLMWSCVGSAPAQGQESARPVAVPSAAPQPEINQNTAELSSHDAPTTFKVNVKLVVVRAVVRDAQGHAVGNLQKEDFQVFDKSKPQTITQFEVEQPGAMAARARQKTDQNSATDANLDKPSGISGAVPERFIAYLFDDVHIEFGDLSQVRSAAERHFATLRPTDRAAIFTTSGQVTLDYTDDRAKLHETLLRLQPRPITGGFLKECLDISYYQADLIINRNDFQAKSVALQEAIACLPTIPGMPAPNPIPVVDATSTRALETGEHETRISLGILNNVVQNISRKPGQRSIVVLSPGFIAPTLEYEYNAIIDRALRSQVVINALDARGLYIVMPFGDISNPPLRPPPGAKGLIEFAAASAQADLLSVLADSTGGVFFQHSNDYDEGFRRVAETPEYSYILAFAPQNLKLDGSFHSLKITLKSSQKLSLQARRGYYAPKNFASPEEQAKQEIEEATFSQDEVHNLPVNLHTQFFKAGDEDAKLIVLAHVDVKHLRFRKVEGRNNNTLTCVSALFSRNGNFLQGMEKIVTLRLKDETLEHKLAAGLTLKTSFDVKPGSYLVRLVVRDAEGQTMSAENGTVEIR